MKNKNILSFKGLFLLPLVATFLFTGCEKSILSDDPGSVDQRNIRLRIFHYMNSNLLRHDSVYNINGSRVIIDEIDLLLSDYIFDNSGDSISTDGYTLTDYRDQEAKIGYLKPNSSVSGVMYFKVGLDSLENLTTPSDWPEGHFLANSNLYNSTAGSYNAIVVKGRIFDPTKPEEETPSIPMSYEVATQLLVTQMDSQKSFSVPVGKSVIIDVLFDINDLFASIDPILTPVISSDPTDQDDYDNAILLRANFEDAFRIQ